MYLFIDREIEKTKITPDHIHSLEKSWELEFPDILKEYYIQYNGAVIQECSFQKHGMDFCVVHIFTVNYGTNPLEKHYANARRNRAIPKTFIPFALDEDEDSYYWDSKNGKIYYLSLENVENPIEICGNMCEFFEIMNASQAERN